MRTGWKWRQKLQVHCIRKQLITRVCGWWISTCCSSSCVCVYVCGILFILFFLTGVKLQQNILPSSLSDCCVTVCCEQCCIQVSSGKRTNQRHMWDEPEGKREAATRPRADLASGDHSRLVCFQSNLAINIKKSNYFSFFLPSQGAYLLSATHLTSHLYTLTLLLQRCYFCNQSSISQYLVFIWTTFNLFIHSKPEPNPSSD